MPTPAGGLNATELQAAVNAIRWFHRMDLGQGIVTPGLDDTPAKLRRIQMPDDLRGRTVLDIGAWDGFFSFEAERRGASRVLAVDSFCWGRGGWGTKAGFDLAHRALGSRVESRELTVDQLSRDAVGAFDVVFFFGVLYHLRDPLAALERVAAVTGSMLLLETKVDLLDESVPAMAFYPGSELNNDPTNWWAPNVPGLTALLHQAGFSRVAVVSPPRPRWRRFWLALSRGANWRRTARQDRVVVHAWKE